MSHRLAVLLPLCLCVSAVSPGAAPVDDRTAILQALHDYADGFYGGEPDRVARAVSPALSKRQVMPRPGASALLAEMNAETLVDAAHGAKLAPADRRLTAEVLMAGPETASGRVFSARFNDYVLLAKRQGAWQIVSVLWHAPPTGASEDHTEAVSRAVRAFATLMTGATGADAGAVLHPLAHLRVLAPGRQGRPRVLMDQNAERFVAGLARGFGTVPGDAAQAQIVVEGIDHDIAAARFQLGQTTAHLHLARLDGTWRVVAMLQWTAPATP